MFSDTSTKRQHYLKDAVQELHILSFSSPVFSVISVKRQRYLKDAVQEEQTIILFSPAFSVLSMMRQHYLKDAVQDHYSNHYYPFPDPCSLICPWRGSTTLKTLSKSSTYPFPALHSLLFPWRGNTTLKMLFKITNQITIILFQPCVLCYVCEETALP